MATVIDMTKPQAALGEMKERAEEALGKTRKFAEDWSEFAKGNLEAVMTSGRLAAKGAETLAQDAAETAKRNFETAGATFRSMTAVKSPTELLDLQRDYAKTAFDGMVADASRFSETIMKLMGEVAQPFSVRYAVAAEKIKTPTI